jgi:xylulokinase
MPAAYVAGRMAGIRVADAFMDYTFLHFTALADARSCAWSDELCGLLGIRKEQLPSIVEPWRQVGEVGDQAAADFGLPVGLPIAAGAGDTAAGALGAGAVTPGILLDTAGTAAVLAACTSRFCADVEHSALIVMRSVVEGVWNPLAYIAGGGLLIPWFRETFPSGDSGEPDEEIFDRIFEQALCAPAGCQGLVFSPHLGGRICPAGPGMRGSWVGFSWSHQRPHFIRAMVESVGYEYVRYLRILKELFPEVSFTEARVIGGGARSTAWNRIKASILGVHYRRVRAPESATWGCALIAAKATGLIGDLATAATEFAPVCAEVIDPDTNDRAAYQRGLETYLRWQHLFERGYEAER